MNWKLMVKLRLELALMMNDSDCWERLMREGCLGARAVQSLPLTSFYGQVRPLSQIQPKAHATSFSSMPMCATYISISPSLNNQKVLEPAITPSSSQQSPLLSNTGNSAGLRLLHTSSKQPAYNQNELRVGQTRMMGSCKRTEIRQVQNLLQLLAITKQNWLLSRPGGQAMPKLIVCEWPGCTMRGLSLRGSLLRDESVIYVTLALRQWQKRNIITSGKVQQNLAKSSLMRECMSKYQSQKTCMESKWFSSALINYVKKPSPSSSSTLFANSVLMSRWTQYLCMNLQQILHQFLKLLARQTNVMLLLVIGFLSGDRLPKNQRISLLIRTSQGSFCKRNTDLMVDAVMLHFTRNSQDTHIKPYYSSSLLQISQFLRVLAMSRSLGSDKMWSEYFKGISRGLVRTNLSSPECLSSFFVDFLFLFSINFQTQNTPFNSGLFSASANNLGKCCQIITVELAQRSVLVVNFTLAYLICQYSCFCL